MFIELKDHLNLLTFHIRTTEIEYVIEETNVISINGNTIKLNAESFKKVMDYIKHTNKMYYNTYN